MALNYILQNNFKTNVGMRPEARKIGVLITDGKSQDEVVFTSQNLRDSGIELYAIGEPGCVSAHAPLPPFQNLQYLPGPTDTSVTAVRRPSAFQV